jgi:hypothetical protein
MMTKPWLIIFLGGMGQSPPERMVSAVQSAITLDKLEWAAGSGLFQGSILLTDQKDLADRARHLAHVESSAPGFHFGEQLCDLINRYEIERPFYLGGGSGALLDGSELTLIAQSLLDKRDFAITNNLYSTDLIAFHPGSALKRINLPATDNPLAQRLRMEAGLNVTQMERNAASQFDVDTPSDVLILKLYLSTGQHTRTCIEKLEIDDSRLRAIMPLLTDQDAEVLVAGRVGSYVWAHLEAETACRIRALSEERGMRSDGRQEHGTARSILGFHLQEVGITNFFNTLAELGDAAIVDSRVLFAHMGLHPSAPDRFYSDLGEPEKITDPFLREFTEAAISAPIPVVLGGHSLVSGGLYALIDAAWLEINQA